METKPEALTPPHFLGSYLFASFFLRSFSLFLADSVERHKVVASLPCLVASSS